VDADGIPLYMITHGQKAQFLDQVCGTYPRITIPRIGKMFFRGVPATWLDLGSKPKRRRLLM
jgi:hypothetical protein